MFQFKFLAVTHFLINWLGEERDDLYDAVPAKEIVPPEESDVLDIKPGSTCRVVYYSKFYKAKVLKIGMSVPINVYV